MDTARFHRDHGVLDPAALAALESALAAAAGHVLIGLHPRRSRCVRIRRASPTPVGARLLELHDDGEVASRLVWA